jgi:hypothetical protein
VRYEVEVHKYLYHISIREYICLRPCIKKVCKHMYMYVNIYTCIVKKVKYTCIDILISISTSGILDAALTSTYRHNDILIYKHTFILT